MLLAFYAVPVGTVTFLFTDIEGSTALLRRLGDDTYGEVLAGHHALIRSALEAHGGDEVDTQGDAFFAVFDSARACGTAALEMQQKLAAQAWPGGGHVKVRMGIHTGEAARTEAGWVGLDVHRAARIAAVAHGGQVVLSESAAGLVRDNLPAAAALTDLGMHRLKDLGHPERIYQLTATGLQSEFPPLRSLGNPALLNNLPAELTPFIGRQQELADVRALVTSSRLVTLTGAGGAGKTRLALQVAADLLDGSGDGVWLVELAPIADEDGVAAAVCDALHIAVTGGGRATLEALAEALAPQDILIVLDNCEHLIGSCAKIADVLLRRCPKAHLIATSREPLGIGGEAIYRTPSMSVPGPDESGPVTAFDAVALFATRAHSHGVDLPLDGLAESLVASICRRLDGLPLALELAAARLRSMSLQELHDRLDHRFRLLTGGSRAALERQQTLRAAVGWSYGLLNEAEQTLLRRLPAFVSSFDLAAAEAVCGFGDLDALDVADLLGSLVDKSLVVGDQDGIALRYRLLETIRQYAAEKLAEANEQEALTVAASHCSHFLRFAEAAAHRLTGPEQVAWVLRLDADYPNVRSAMQYAAQSAENTGQVLRFAVALRRYLKVRNQHEQAILRLLVPVLNRPKARADLTLYGAALLTAAYSAPLIDVATTEFLAGQAIQVARQLDDARLIIEALTVRVHLYAYFNEARDADRGRACGRESVERSRELGDEALLAESIMEYLFFCEPAHSGALLAEAIASTQRSGDLYVRGMLHQMARFRTTDAADPLADRMHLQEAARILQQFGGDVALVHDILGSLAFADGRLDDAQRELERALLFYRRDGDQVSMAYVIADLACVMSDLGDWSRAAWLHGVAQTLLNRKNAVWRADGMRERQESLAHIRAHVGDEQAEQDYAQGAALSLDEAIDLALGKIAPT